MSLSQYLSRGAWSIGTIGAFLFVSIITILAGAGEVESGKHVGLTLSVIFAWATFTPLFLCMALDFFLNGKHEFGR